jgi:hypothetical protein
VELPKRYELSNRRLSESDEVEFRREMQQVREALALLAAVAQVDREAWKFLLREKCHVKIGKPGEEKYEKDAPVKFLQICSRTYTRAMTSHWGWICCCSSTLDTGQIPVLRA